jgi:glycosyltransferase involved in cell wall biosynthesis
MAKFLKYLWLAKMALIERRRWRSGQGAGAPRVFYGVERLPARTESASGGIIKCQDLEDLFPNTPGAPNLLYLVSSALPPHLPVLLKAVKRAGCPIVLNQNGVAYPAWHPQGWEEANRPLAAAYLAADYVFFQSDFCRVSAERYLGARQGPGEILFNPVDTTVFTPGPARHDSAPVILVSGSHLFRYRLETALLALSALRKRHPGVRMIVAGRYCWGPDENACRQEIQELAIQAGVYDAIDWRGTYTQAEAPALMREAHILLHPKYNDPCPRLVVEAMACGLPVVYSASGGVPELVGPDAGVGVPAPRDWDQDHPPKPDDLANALETVLSNQPAMSAAARQRAVSLLDVKTWQARHVDIFSSYMHLKSEI